MSRDAEPKMVNQTDGRADSPADGATVELSWSASGENTLTQSIAPGLPEGPRPVAPEGPLGARYEDLGLLGRGGMGEVRRAWDRLLERVVALKILREDLCARPDFVERFLAEARVVAALQHPGIVPLYDLGWLPDKRPYFTMKEVQGRTLRELLRAVHQASPEGSWASTPDGWTLRRLVEALRDASAAVSFAHSRAVLHRDLKPQNILVGDYGEVMVVDWGLAKPIDEVERPFSVELSSRSHSRSIATPRGQVAGTPAYMAPEQARGEADRVGPAADVYALGATLVEILTGSPPHREEGKAWTPPASGLPEELLRVCVRALEPEPERRFPEAGALSKELHTWLEGLRRREQALHEVQRADTYRDEARRLREAAEAQTRSAQQLSASLPSWTPIAQKQDLWRAEDEARRLSLEADLAEERVRRSLQAALMREPELPEALDRLAEDAWRRLLAAEAQRDPTEAARAEAALRSWDRGRYSRRLLRPARLTLLSEPAGAEVLLYRMVTRDRRLEPSFERSLGPTPLHNVAVTPGSYRVVLRAPGCREVLLPLLLEREQHWDGVPPGAREPQPIWLPGEGELLPNEVYVPGGWFRAGGDPKASNSLPSRRLWADSFVISRDPITNGQYIHFLNELVDRGEEAEALRWVPRERPGLFGAQGVMMYGRDAQGHFELVPDADGDLWDLDWPVTYVDWACACAYARWLAQRSGLPYRLPSELEWEKAARGVDGRAFPWGDHFEPTWANVRGSSSKRGLPGSVHAHPLDESPYGVQGLGGNVQDWCLDAWRLEGPPTPGDRVQLLEEHSDQRAMRGGYFFAGEPVSRCSSRAGFVATAKDGGRGFRVARSLSPKGPGGTPRG